MKLMVELEGETVPLAGCDYVLWAACGCPRSVATATADDDFEPVVTEADAWRMFFPLKRDREAAKKRGLRMELMTHARYSAEVNPLMSGVCPHEPPADERPSAAGEEQSMPEIRNVDAGSDRRLLVEAALDVIKHESASQRLIQRRMRIGFVKAERLLILLEAAGVVGSRKTGGRHEVLVPRGRADEVIVVLEKELADAATR